MTCDPSTPTIREATQQDAAAIARLAEDAGMGTLTPRGTSYVALDGDRIVGFIRIVEAEGDRYVSPIVVDPQARRLGVGRALMQDARTRYGALLFVAHVLRLHQLRSPRSLGYCHEQAAWPEQYGRRRRRPGTLHAARRRHQSA